MAHRTVAYLDYYNYNVGRHLWFGEPLSSLSHIKDPMLSVYCSPGILGIVFIAAAA